MKKLRSFFNFILLICLVAPLNGQETKFIELTTSDTVILNPVKIIYEINVGGEKSWMGMTYDDIDDSDAESLEKKDIEDILQNKKFFYSISEGNNYTISEGDAQITFLIELENESELKRLYNVMNGLHGITGGIKDVIYESTSTYYKTIYTSLYLKAKEQASILATISGNSLGELISAIDIQPVNDSYSNMLQDIYKQTPLSFLQYPTEIKNEMIFQMRFKFEIK